MHPLATCTGTVEVSHSDNNMGTINRANLGRPLKYGL